MADKPERTKLEEMSSELPERERKELLAKITKRLSPDDREDVLPVELRKEERERLIAEEMDRLSTWIRFLLWMRRLFSGKSQKDIFLNLKLGQLKRVIKQLNPGLSGFETRDLTPKFARQIYDLYAAIYPLMELFESFHKDQDFQEQALNHVFAAQYDESKRDVGDLVPAGEMEDIYAESGIENEVRKQVLRRYNEYIRKMPDKVFSQVEEGIKPLIYLKNLVLFPYSALFRNFNYYLGERLEDKYPYFDHAPVMLMLDQLERLYHATYLAEKLGSEWFVHEEYLHYFCLRQQEIEEADELESQEIDRMVMELTSQFSTLVEAVQRFNLKVPLLELLRYFRRDPYFRLAFSVPSIRVKNIYTNAFRNRIMGQLDEKMVDIKRNVIERKIKETFKTDQLLDLFYYNDRPNFDFTKLGLPYFTYTKTLVVLYNYLSKIYKGYIQEIIQIVSQYVLNNNRLAQARLMQCASGLEELEARIVLLDRSLSPDEDDGKTLMRHRHRIATDIAQQKMYRNFIIDKDNEAKALIDQGEENLLGAKKIFDEIISSPMESVKSVLKTLHYYRGKNQTLVILLRSTSERIGDFHDLLLQLLVLEKGS